MELVCNIDGNDYCGDNMTIYIHDLNISEKCMELLLRSGLLTLDDVCHCDIKMLFLHRNGVENKVLSEINEIVSRADEINCYFEDRNQRIRNKLPEVKGKPIESLTISERSVRNLHHAGIDTIDELMKKSRKDFYHIPGFERSVLDEIIAAADEIIQIEPFVFHETAKALPAEPDETPENDEAAEPELEIEPHNELDDIPLDNLHLSFRAGNALKRAGIHTAGALVRLTEEEIAELKNVGVQTKREILAAVSSFLGSDGENINKPEPEPIVPVEIPDSEPCREFDEIPLDKLCLSVRSGNALKRAGIKTVGSLLRLSEEEIMSLKNIGARTRDELLAVIAAILENQEEYLERFTREPKESDKIITEEEPRKGFDYVVIDRLIEGFRFKTTAMTEWFGVSRQRIAQVMWVRSRKSAARWTGKALSEKESEILLRLADDHRFDYSDDELLCRCMNNRKDDFVCIFIYENEIKCFFLSDLPDEIREKIVGEKMHVFTERELSEDLSGQIVYVLKKPYFRPNHPEYFGACAQQRGMTVDNYSVFLKGYPHLEQRAVTDDRIINFLTQNMKDGKVYISADSQNSWFKNFAHRQGLSINELIELYGFEASDGNSLLVREKHSRELQKYIVYGNLVFLPKRSHIYKLLTVYTNRNNMDLDVYIRSLGFERTSKRPQRADDALESDMAMRHSDASFEEKIFAAYPLIGSAVLKPETVRELKEKARKYIDSVLENPKIRLPLRAEMQITIAIINIAKDWKIEENGQFWNYITLCFGYRDSSGSVLRLLQSSLEHAMKKNNRFFMESENGREFKATALIHALSTKRSWMTLFDFLFDFYKNNLSWRVIPKDPLIEVMVRALRQMLSGGSKEDMELTISSKAYSFQEGIRKLILYRPKYSHALFERLITKIDSLVNSETKPAKKYEELLCEEWFAEKITAIANTKKEQKQGRHIQREIAIDYSRIRAKYILRNETDVQLVLPDIRLMDESVQRAVLTVNCNSKTVITRNMSWYGNELGKTLNGVSVSIPDFHGEDKLMRVEARIVCDGITVYDSEETLFRRVLLFSGKTEIAAGQITRGGYTLVVRDSAEVRMENAEATEIDGVKDAGIKVFYIELKDGYYISADNQLIACDSESGTNIRVIMPDESEKLPMVTLLDTEACLAYMQSACQIVFGNSDCLGQYLVLMNEKRIELSSMQCSGNGLVYTLPLRNETGSAQIRVIDLDGERLVFDKTFLLVTEADCCFNREFYYSADDYSEAECYLDIDDFSKAVPIAQNDTEIRVPFRGGELHMDIPKVELEETTGAWFNEKQAAWFIGAVPQASLFKVTKPRQVNIRFLIGGKDMMYDGKGVVSIGNALYALGGAETPDSAEIVMKVTSPTQSGSYSLTTVFFKERFLKRPEFRTENNKLFWNRGGLFVGKPGREFTLQLTGDEKTLTFRFHESTEYIALPEDTPIGNYRYEISIQTGGLFKKTTEIIAGGDCVIGDRNLLRFMNRRIVIDAVTDEFREEAGHISIRECYIDQIAFRGVEETSEGLCPVYSGVLYTINRRGTRYEFSYSIHTNDRGIKKTMVNPVRIVYISDNTLCITDADGDGLYYYYYYDRIDDAVVFELTDREYTKLNKNKYSNADLYIYRTERN